MRLIDADALMEHAMSDKLDSRELIAHMIDSAPTIEPKRGEWIRDTSSPIAYRCTACNTLQHWSVIKDGRYHFCPHCGAEMGEREGE